MNTFWMSKFDELAEFNADNDKSKYNSGYLLKMMALQDEYNERLVAHAESRGDVVFGASHNNRTRELLRYSNYRMSEIIKSAAVATKPCFDSAH